MNKQRRKQLQEIANTLSELKEQLDILTQEEQDAFDNLPEGIQYSDKGTEMEENVSEMEDILSGLEDISTRLIEL